VRVLKPQQLDERTYLSIEVLTASSQLRHSKAGAAGNHDFDLPPLWHGLHGLGDVLRTNDEGCPVQDHAVDGGLTGQTPQAVAIGLDLVTVEQAVDDRDVDTNLPSAEAQLLKESNVRFAPVSVPEVLQ
jgi:hypothetical protein